MALLQSIKKCMTNPDQIRNVCILAHVDHGKTTISDSLLATNGLISKRSAGLMRYLDDRHDEQERGITMKSSAVSLCYTLNTSSETQIVLNLIDTPGHIDFSTEVSAAIRICDGALIIVDLVEGVCVQTKEAIKQAYDEKVKMILVINKLDRFIVELNKSVDDIFQGILRIIEDANAYIAELKKFDLEFDEEGHDAEFSPDLGNVIFCSAIDGWGFTLRQIAEMFVNIKIIENESVESLTKKMWDFDYYIDSNKKIIKGAVEKKKENVFMQLCLKTVFYVYFTLVVRMERDKLEVIVKKLNIKTITREMKNNNPRMQVKAILQAWMPLAHAIINQCYEVIPAPSKLEENRINHLVDSKKFIEDPILGNTVEGLVRNFTHFECETCVVYISKMFLANNKNLSQNKPKIFVPSKEERDAVIKARLEAVKLSETSTSDDGERNDGKTNDGKTNGGQTNDSKTNGGKTNDGKTSDGKTNDSKTSDGKTNDVKTNDSKTNDGKTIEVDKTNELELSNFELADHSVIALGRIFSGTISTGQDFYIIPPSYKPDFENLQNNEEEYLKNHKIQKIKIKDLYLLLGRELILIDSVSAGNIFGIGGLENNVLRTATLSNSLKTLPLTTHYSIEPIVRNSIEPLNPKMLPKLRNALKLLMQSDSCVQVIMQETGELVLLTAGDVHLAKCLEDLKTKFPEILVKVSEPMVSLRETIQQQRKINDFKNPSFNVLCDVKDFNFRVKVIAIPLPEKVSKFIQMNHRILRWIEEHQNNLQENCPKSNEKNYITNEKVYKTDQTKTLISRLKEQLKQTFDLCKIPWPKMHGNIWSVGKNSDPLNVLFNASDYSGGNIFNTLNIEDKRSIYDQYIVNAFDMCCKSGPICEEPLENCAFVVTKFELRPVETLQTEVQENKITTQLTANISLNLKSAFREAFEKQSRRLMEPIFTTDIQVNTSILGKVYSVISKRHGKILEAMGMDEQEKIYLVKAQIPVVMSDGFANEIRRTTSGEANPTLRFSHFDVIEGDPFYEPDSEDSDEDVAAVESANRANRLMKDVRKRKGLQVDDQVVVRAEKQRTLNRKK